MHYNANSSERVSSGQATDTLERNVTDQSVVTRKAEHRFLLRQLLNEVFFVPRERQLMHSFHKSLQDILSAEKSTGGIIAPNPYTDLIKDLMKNIGGVINQSSDVEI